jgi:non-specific serine/threonine protein kinase
MGRHEEAREQFDAARAHLDPGGPALPRVVLDSHDGLMRVLTGDPDAAQRCAEAALDRLAAHPGEWLGTGLNHLVHGLARALSWDGPGCAEDARSYLRLRVDLRDIVGLGYCLELLAGSEYLAGRHEQALWLFGAADRVWEYTGGRINSGAEAMHRIHEALVAEVREVVGEARAERLYARGARYPLDRLVAQLLTGGPDGAALPAGVFERVPDQRGPEAEGDGPGEADRPGAAGAAAEALAALTRRERQVAELVAEGLSNRQIAAELVISKRTADAHVEHILAKLRFSSRSEITAVLRSLTDPGDPLARKPGL